MSSIIYVGNKLVFHLAFGVINLATRYPPPFVNNNDNDDSYSLICLPAKLGTFHSSVTISISTIPGLSLSRVANQTKNNGDLKHFINFHHATPES